MATYVRLYRLNTYRPLAINATCVYAVVYAVMLHMIEFEPTPPAMRWPAVNLGQRANLQNARFEL